MKICMIAEGSYPYVTGGVSSWIQMLISGMSEHQFVICAVGAREKDRGKYNYRIPANVVEVKEIFLDEAMKNTGRWGLRLGINNQERKALIKLLSGEQPEWNELFALFRGYRSHTVQGFLMSRDFFDILKEVYRLKYANIPFADYYWTLRSMINPLMYIISQGVPEADLYHSVSAGYAGVLGGLGKALYHKPFILTEHGIYTREREEEIIKADWIKGLFKDIWIEHFYCLSRCAYDHADKVITLFNKNREIQVELGCDSEKIEIIPNGIQVEHFHNLAQKDVADDYINVGAVVRIVPIKDIKTMLQGFAWAKEKHEKIRFYIMGPADEDIEYFNECRQLVESNAIRDVIFTGRVNIIDYIGRMDILVLSSISEGQPLAILEGMAGGKPFIATDVGSCRELIYGSGDDYGDAGVVVPVMDHEKIGKTIVKLCKNKELRVMLGKNALRRVAGLYSKDRMINAYRRVYNNYGELSYGWHRV